MIELIDYLSGLILLGLNLVPIALIAALIRGGLRGRRDRKQRKGVDQVFK